MKTKEQLLAELEANQATNPPQIVTPPTTQQTPKGGNVRLPAGAMKLARALATSTKRSIPMAIYALLEANAKK